MDLVTLGPLRVRRVVKNTSRREPVTGENNGDKPPLTLVLCHGFGAPGDDLVGLAGELDVPAGTVMLFPEALLGLREALRQPLYGNGRAWWLIDITRFEIAMAGGTPRDLTNEVPEGLAEARSALSEMLDAIAMQPEKAGIEDPSRLVIGGFSQGAMLSIDLALREPMRALTGLVVLSGTLLAEQDWLPLIGGRRALPVFQSHGESDPILPFTIALRLRDALVAGGLDVTFDPFGGPHTIPRSTLERLGEWLRVLP